jgi:hypothetical protein
MKASKRQRQQHKKAAPKRKEMGAFLQRFSRRHETFKQWFPLITGSFLLLSSLTGAIILFFESRSRIMVHGPAILLAVVPLPLLLILLGLMTGLILVIIASAGYYNALYLYENGFIIRKGRRKIPWKWAEINRFDAARIKNKLARQPFKEQVVVHMADESGRQIMLQNTYQQFEVLLQHLRAKILPILYAKARQQLSHQKPILFHANLQATSHGIQIGKRTYTWDQLKPTQIKNGHMTLFLKDNGQPIFKSKIKQIWNLDLLLTLLETPPNPDQFSPK